MKTSQLPKTFASLRVTSDDLDIPDVCTALFNVRPDLSYRKGDMYFTNRHENKAKYRKLSAWIYSTERVVDKRDIKAHTKVIEALLSKKEDFVRAAIKDTKSKLLVSLFWHGRADDNYPFLDSDFEGLVEKCGGSVEVDFGKDHLDAIEAA